MTTATVDEIKQVKTSDIRGSDTKEVEMTDAEVKAKELKACFKHFEFSICSIGSIIYALISGVVYLLYPLSLILLFLIFMFGIPVTKNMHVSDDFRLFKEHSEKEVKLLPSEQVYFEQQLSGQLPQIDSQYTNIVVDILRHTNERFDFISPYASQPITIIPIGETREVMANDIFRVWHIIISDLQSSPKLSQLPVDFRLAYSEYLLSLDMYLQYSQDMLDFSHADIFFDFGFFIFSYLDSSYGTFESGHYVERRQESLQLSFERFNQARLRLRSVGIQHGVDVKTHFLYSYLPIHDFTPFSMKLG